MTAHKGKKGHSPLFKKSIHALFSIGINAVDKIKKEGILILDNSDREKYHGIFYIFDEWERVDFSNGLQQTTVWRNMTIDV